MTKVNKTIGIIIFIIALISPVVVEATTSLSFFTGTVSFFDRKRVVVSGMEYQIIEKCEYLKHTKRNNAYFEDKASPNDVGVGRSVILHINGNVVDKIIIEEWKQ